jgi:hypothetical protein
VDTGGGPPAAPPGVVLWLSRRSRGPHAGGKPAGAD